MIHVLLKLPSKVELLLHFTTAGVEWISVCVCVCVRVCTGQSSELSVHASYFNKLIIIHQWVRSWISGQRLVWEESESELVQQEEGWGTVVHYDPL